MVEQYRLQLLMQHLTPRLHYLRQKEPAIVLMVGLLEQSNTRQEFGKLIQMLHWLLNGKDLN